MIKCGSGTSGFLLGCALFFCLMMEGCVKREPRVAETDPAQKNGDRDKCGLICRIQQDRETAKDPLKEQDLAPAAPSREQPTHSKSGGLLDRLSYRFRARGDRGPSGSEPADTSKGVVHIVTKGETLWRICSTYGVDMELVSRLNDINDPSSISPGQRIWIPGVDRVMDVPVSTASNSNDPGAGDSLSESRPATTIKPNDPSLKGSLLCPVPEGEISSGFGAVRSGHLHEGVDIVAPMGCDIVAADDGKVVYSDNKIRGYGNMIIIKHAGDLVTVYAHNSKNLVRVGDLVKRGEKIAEVGQTGNASCPHCHFEVRQGEKPVDPEYFLPK